MFRVPLLLLVLLGSAGPLRAQSLIDATTAGAVQNSLNTVAQPKYGGALKAATTTLNNSQKPVDRYLGLPVNGVGAPAGTAQAAPAPASAAAPGTPRPQVNGQVIGLCTSGELCLSQIRRAMGLR
jgi:hypothetical protein